MSPTTFIKNMGLIMVSIFVLNQAKKLSTGARDIISGKPNGGIEPAAQSKDLVAPSVTFNEPVFSVIA